MPVNLAPVEFLIVIAFWLIPIALIVWFIWAVTAIRASLRHIEQRLDRLDPPSQP